MECIVIFKSVKFPLIYDRGFEAFAMEYMIPDLGFCMAKSEYFTSMEEVYDFLEKNFENIAPRY